MSPYEQRMLARMKAREDFLVRQSLESSKSPECMQLQEALKKAKDDPMSIGASYREWWETWAALDELKALRLDIETYGKVHEQARIAGLVGYANDGFFYLGGVRVVDDLYEARWAQNQAAFARCEAAYLAAPE